MEGSVRAGFSSLTPRRFAGGRFRSYLRLMSLLIRPADADLFSRLDAARTLMETRFETSLQLPELAAAACFSKYHFLREFNRVFHRTPRQYLTEVRIKHARHLLKHSDVSVTEVCFLLGFESLGSFSSLFRRYVGESPAEYRRRHRRIFALGAIQPAVLVPSCFLSMFGLGPE